MDDDAGRRFAAWLQAELDLRGMSQAELARRAGMSTSATTKWIKNARLPGPASLDAIAAALTMDPREVYKAAGFWLPGEAEDPPELRALVGAMRRVRLTEERRRTLRLLLDAWAETDRRATPSPGSEGAA